MASRSTRQKRTLSTDQTDQREPPNKRKRNVPEEQLKLERVLQSVSKDRTLLEKIKYTEKFTKHPIQKAKGGSKSASNNDSPKSLSEKLKQKRSDLLHKDIINKNQNKTKAEPNFIGTEKNSTRKSCPKNIEKKKTEVKKEKSAPHGRETGLKELKCLKKENSSKITNRNQKTPKISTVTAPIAEVSRKGQNNLKSVEKMSSLSTRSPRGMCSRNPESKHTKIKGKTTKSEMGDSSKGTISKGQRKPQVTSGFINNNVQTKAEKQRNAATKDSTTKKFSPKKEVVMKTEDDSDSEESDWEEVEDVVGQADVDRNQLPSEPVTITLQGPDLMNRRRRKGQCDLDAIIRRRINRQDQELQLHMHKVHLLCLLSHGFHRNRTCKERDLLAHGLSVVPVHLLERDPVHWDVTFLGRIVKWFHAAFTIAYDLKENNTNLKQTLLHRLSTKDVASEAELVFLMVIILRSMGASVRLVTSLQPVSHKCPKKLTIRRAQPDAKGAEPEQKAQNPPKPEPESRLPTLTKQDTEVMDMIRSVEGKHGSLHDTAKHSLKGKSETPRTKQSATPRQKTKSLKRRSTASKVNYDEDGSQCVSSEDTKTAKNRRKSASGQDHNTDIIVLPSSDSDFEEVPLKFRKSPSLSKASKKKYKKSEMVSSDSDDVTVTKVVKKEKGSDYFLEVYIERAENWIPVDCVRCRVNTPGEIESRATQPVYYALGYDDENCIKDVTSRYASGWMSTTRKLRKDETWWEEVLLPYTPRNKLRDEAEDAKMQTQQIRKPLPTSISEFKNHPLYALKRHLLKFEAIYPANAVPVGYIKGEPVYSRDNVENLHTRETWLKDGRAVRVKEKPYKLVKARKKRSRKSYEVDLAPKEEQAECFGRWQTEQYMPPPAYNGKVPRNEYGNVEVFKPWMIPAGAVHLQIPGLNKVARKLNIDCAPAMVGWDFHGGYTHPVLDGFIVCEEHKDILLAAWDEEQEIQREKEEEKREQRALSNWKKMIKSLLIRERMKKRFDLQEVKTNVTASGTEEAKEKAQDTQFAWPANRPDLMKKLSTADQTSLFPSEEI